MYTFTDSFDGYKSFRICFSFVFSVSLDYLVTSKYDKLLMVSGFLECTGLGETAFLLLNQLGPLA